MMAASIAAASVAASIVGLMMGSIIEATTLDLVSGILVPGLDGV